MRAIALAVMFLALTSRSAVMFLTLTSRSAVEEAQLSDWARGFLGWTGVISFLGFWICLIGGW